MSDNYNPDEILEDPKSHPLHKMYAAINIAIRDKGEHWYKCANCGDPYPETEEWQNSTVCSDSCGNSYIRYLNEGF